MSRCLTTCTLTKKVAAISSLLAQELEGAKLIERMQRCPLHVLSERVLLGKAVGPDDARDRRGAAKPLLLDQEFERSITPAAGWNLKHAGFGTAIIEHRPDGEALKQRAARDILRKLFD